MIKKKYCKTCKTEIVTDFVCDNCRKNLLKEYYGVPITVEFSYGHALDGEIRHYCSDKCLLNACNLYIKNSDDRFIYGKQKEK